METMEMFGAVLVSTFKFNSLHVSLRNLGHCYLMMDDLQQAYSAYQQALYHLRDPKVSYFNLPYLHFAIAYKQIQEPKLWYGIGILYDRYGSLEHAEEAFSQVMRMQPDFEKANEIYFRLGIIYKQQQKYQQSLEVCILKRQ
jgi:glucose repression mediator protein